MSLSSKFSIRQAIERKKRVQLHNDRLKSGRLPFAVKPVFAVTHFVGDKNYYSGLFGKLTTEEFNALCEENTDAYFKVRRCIQRPCINENINITQFE